MIKRAASALAMLWLVAAANAGERPAAFEIITLGAQGGIVDGDLSAFLVAAQGRTRYAALDAGTLRAGLAVALERGALSHLPLAPDSQLRADGWLLKEGIRAVLLSHPHLDHVAGLILASPDDGAKPILGLAPTLDALRDHLFAAPIWANFANEGAQPRIGKYRYEKLSPGRPQPLADTGLTVEAFPLAHAGGLSTAFLLARGDDHLVYFGDTGPDDIEKSHALDKIWSRLAPLIRAGQLRGIMIEVSYPNGRADNALFGHLTPAWLGVELGRLAAKVDPKTSSLAGLPVLITHVKPSLIVGEDPRAAIAKQLEEANTLGVRYSLPRQGDKIGL